MLGRLGGNLTVLALHRVVTEEEKAESMNKPMMVTEGQFESLLVAIRRYCVPISLSEAVDNIRRGQKFKPGTVAITFDDGYYDVYERAYSLLKSYDMPATMFVTTGVIDNPLHYLWWDEIDYLCRAGRAGSDLLREEDSAAARHAHDCISQLHEGRSAQLEAKIRRVFANMQVADRVRLVARIRGSASELGPRAQLMLTWEKIREMSDIFEIANHTVTHPMLSTLDTAEIYQEIVVAKARIEDETNRQCNGLAYPSGDFSKKVISVAESAGVEYAVTTRFSNNSHNSDCMSLDRKDAGYLFLDDKISPAFFNIVMSGATDWLRRRGGSRTEGKAAASTVNQIGGTVETDDAPRVPDARPLIVHVVHHLTVGGLENGLVNLVNRLQPAAYRHAIVCLTDYSDFRNRIKNPNVDVYALHKRPGKDMKIYLDLWRLFRRLKPDVVHTRNIATLEAQLPALLAGVPHRVHGEHGRDSRDIDGGNAKYLLLRKVFRPLISQYVALSQDLQQYLQTQVGISGHKISHICNGVDTDIFRPAEDHSGKLLPDGFYGEEIFIMGTIGRMEPEKDPATLAKAFVRLVNEYPQGRQKLRLVMVGDGILLEQVKAILEKAGVSDLAWLPGERDDVPLLLRAMDVFVLSSLVEGISNTILEAMACGLPVVATRVGGNSEIVEEEVTGLLVPRSDPASLALAIHRYIDNPDLRHSHGAMARRRTVERFSIGEMVRHYQDLYGNLLDSSRKSTLFGRLS